VYSAPKRRRKTPSGVQQSHLFCGFTAKLIWRTADGRTRRPASRSAVIRATAPRCASCGEAGLCLAFDGAKLTGGAACGVLTPATALGEALVPRLRAAGFEIVVGA